VSHLDPKNDGTRMGEKDEDCDPAVAVAIATDGESHATGCQSSKSSAWHRIDAEKLMHMEWLADDASAHTCSLKKSKLQDSLVGVPDSCARPSARGRRATGRNCLK